MCQYIVRMQVDGGGGTTDISWHKAVASGGRTTLEDAAHREMIVYGGRRMDDGFNALVQKRLGSIYTTWKDDPKRANDYMDLIYNKWESVKHKFVGTGGKKYAPISLPYSLTKEIAQVRGEGVGEVGCEAQCLQLLCANGHKWTACMV